MILHALHIDNLYFRLYNINEVAILLHYRFDIVNRTNTSEGDHM